MGQLERRMIYAYKTSDVRVQPCFCLCLGLLLQTTRSLPFLFTNLQPEHLSFRDPFTLYPLVTMRGNLGDKKQVPCLWNARSKGFPIMDIDTTFASVLHWRVLRDIVCKQNKRPMILLQVDTPFMLSKQAILFR